MSKQFHPGMGQAVAERTILRKKMVDGVETWEDWSDVARRVALGNSLLCKDEEEQKEEFKALYKHLSRGNTLMSGRHLQHGDETQPSRNMEVYTNCSTSSNSFLLFYLLMNGSGVGRCYDDDMMLVDWDNAPTVRCVLDETHPDFDYSAHESVRDAKHKYGTGRDVMWFTVPDTREGWAKALEVLEVAAFEKIHKDKLLILDFSQVRPKGSPIHGMQNRPASGPVPLMNAFNKAMTIRGAGLDKWKQSIYIDHYFAECVLVGGARRAARMSTKYWRDRSVLDFIVVKRPIEFDKKSVSEIVDIRKTSKPMSFLWSSNNSITVDQDFWDYLALQPGDAHYLDEDAVHARRVFDLATAASYGDGTGEPGFINVHKLNQNSKNIETLGKGEYVGSAKYTVNEDTQLYLDRLMRRARKKPYFMIVNPCVTGDTWVMTSEGAKQVVDLVGVPFLATVNGKNYQASGFWSNGKKLVYEITTNRGYSVKATSDHRFQVMRNRRQKLGGGYNYDLVWVKVEELKNGDQLMLNRHIDGNSTNSWDGEGTFAEGWLLGQIIGDGGHNPDKYHSYVRFWGNNKSYMSTIAKEYVDTLSFKPRSDFHGGCLNKHADCETTTCISLTELANKFIHPVTKDFKKTVEEQSSAFYEGLLSGLFDADGTVLLNIEKGRSIRLGQSNVDRLLTVQRLLSRLGIASTVYKNRREAGYKKLPDGKGKSQEYWCQTQHELTISKDNIVRFAKSIGFKDPNKNQRLTECINTFSKMPYEDSFITRVDSVTPVGEMEVFDVNVQEVNAFDANGLMAHNCGEIPLAIWGAFCVIADVVPFHAETLDEAEDAFRVTTRALMRVNGMDSVYKKEVTRTNRIGVGITGLHEFAWKFFKLGFHDLIDEKKSIEFWKTIARFKQAVQDEARKYAKKTGVKVPHTDTTLKPAGTTSKLFGLTEAAHLAAMEFYLRWVQFSINDPLVEKYRRAGYPVRELKSYKNTVIVGFPTSPVVSMLGLGDKLVTAGKASAADQYKWIKLLEKYWLRGVDENGEPLEQDTGNQISYTLKYDPKAISYEEFRQVILNNQSQVKCCSVMPQEDTSSFEYLPEEAVTKAQYEAVASHIRSTLEEDISFEHVDCASGACPIDFKAQKEENVETAA
jgi:intein/homing endonuclease